MLNWKIFYARPKIYGHSRDEFVYREGSHAMVIYAERMPEGVKIDLKSINKWLPPHEDEVISQDERFEILDKFCQCLKARRIKYTTSAEDYLRER